MGREWNVDGRSEYGGMAYRVVWDERLFSKGGGVFCGERDGDCLRDGVLVSSMCSYRMILLRR